MSETRELLEWALGQSEVHDCWAHEFESVARRAVSHLEILIHLMDSAENDSERIQRIRGWSEKGLQIVQDFTQALSVSLSKRPPGSLSWTVSRNCDEHCARFLSGRELDGAVAHQVLGWKLTLHHWIDGSDGPKFLTPDGGERPGWIPSKRWKNLYHPAFFVPKFHRKLSLAHQLAKDFGLHSVPIDGPTEELATAMCRAVLVESIQRKRRSSPIDLLPFQEELPTTPVDPPNEES